MNSARRRVLSALIVLLVLAPVLTATAPAPPVAADHNPDQHRNLDLLAAEANTTEATNSDLAFWGDRAYVGNYDGFRIFDISDPIQPELITDFKCFGPQNDPVVWHNKLLFLAVDQTLAGPDCGSPAVDNDDPAGWEGVRIFDVSDPVRPKFVDAVYTDCGAHTITLFPRNQAQLLLYVSSYPLRPGPTCAQVRGPEAGNNPLHGVIQVIEVPVFNPAAARKIAEPPITYPGDADDQFVWAEHGLPAPPTLEPAARACHDIAVFVEFRLAAGACIEQAQLWRIDARGIPDTTRPLWVFDDQVDETGVTGDPADPGVVVDFWHSATFSHDGSVVNFIDESFGEGCPPTTPAPGATPAPSGNTGIAGDTGRMFFLDTETGEKRSHYMVARPEAEAYCSAHVGNTTVVGGRDLLVNAWYMGGLDVIDFTDPTAPTEVAFYDIAPAGATGSDNWAAYWYAGPGVGAGAFPIYANDGVHNPATGRGFQVLRALLGNADFTLDHLNPQTQ